MVWGGCMVGQGRGGSMTHSPLYLKISRTWCWCTTKSLKAINNNILDDGHTHNKIQGKVLSILQVDTIFGPMASKQNKKHKNKMLMFLLPPILLKVKITHYKEINKGKNAIQIDFQEKISHILAGNYHLIEFIQCQFPRIAAQGGIQGKKGIGGTKKYLSCVNQMF